MRDLNQLWVHESRHEKHSGERLATEAEILAAAANLDGAERFGWCVRHAAQDAGTPDEPLGYCWDGYYLARATPQCQMVVALVIPLSDKETPR